MLDINKIKSDFPILQQQINSHPLTYLDNAATTQKPKSVIEAISNYYTNYNSNVHRGVHTLSQRATEKYEQSRDKVKDFLGAESREEIIFTKNDTESLNLVAQKWGEANLVDGDEVILSVLEHHSNIVPWQLVAQKTGAKLRFVLLKDGHFDYEHFYTLLNEKTKFVSLSQGSNVTGEILDFSKIIPAAHEKGALVMADAGQTVAHFLTNINTTLKEIDFITFSSHKIYGPTGVGVLYGRKHHLENMEPLLGGGDMIKEVFEDYSTWNDLPYKFEAGTPNIADVIGLGSSIDYLNSLNKVDVINHEEEVTKYAIEKLSQLNFIQLYSFKKSSELIANGQLEQLPIISFNVKGVHPHDVGSILDQYGVAIRTGHHCAQPLIAHLGEVATARASFALYNTKEDIDHLLEALNKVKEVFGI